MLPKHRWMSKEQLFPSQNWRSNEIKPLHFYSTQKWLLPKSKLSYKREWLFSNDTDIKNKETLKISLHFYSIWKLMLPKPKAMPTKCLIENLCPKILESVVALKISSAFLQYPKTKLHKCSKEVENFQMVLQTIFKIKEMLKIGLYIFTVLKKSQCSTGKTGFQKSF
jgi:hypothetical protein